MKKFIKPAKISGELTAPASKSIAQRQLLLASVLNGPSRISLGPICDDIKSCATAVEDLGAEVQFSAGQYLISPAKEPAKSQVNCGESGTCYRMIAALCARAGHEVELKAEGSLASRPMQMVEQALLQLGVSVSSPDHKPPLKIKGPIRPGSIEIDGSISSQLLSGLLLTLPFCPGQFVLKVSNLKRRPYVELTLEVLKNAGVEVHYSADLKYFQISGPQSFPGKNFETEADWSSVLGLLVAGAVAGKLTVKGVVQSSGQADKSALKALEDAGAAICWNADSITVAQPGSSMAAEDFGRAGVRQYNSLKAFEFDAEDCPDSIPVLVALAANCQGQSVIKGANRLKHKESDRASALCQEYQKLGIKVYSQDNLMIIEGGKIKGGRVSAHNDHRIAMSLAIAALNSADGIEIEGSESVHKSYPDFFSDLERVMQYE